MAQDLNMNGFDIVNPLEIRYDGTSRPFVQLRRSNASDVNLAPFVQLGKDASDYAHILPFFNAAGALINLEFYTVSSGGASAAGFGDIVFKPDNVERMRLTAAGNLTLQGNLTVVGDDIFCDTYRATADSDMRMHHSPTDGWIIFYDDNNTEICYFHQVTIGTRGSKVQDIGITGTPFDDVYADDFRNESAWEDFLNPAQIIKNVKSIMKDGEKRIDHSTMPDWLRTIDKVLKTINIEGKEVVEWDETQSRVDENSYSINRMQVILIQAIQELTDRLEQLEMK